MQRSIFHPMGGVHKNHCSVEYPEYLDLRSFTTCGTNEIYFANSNESEALGWSKSVGQRYQRVSDSTIKSSENFEPDGPPALESASSSYESVRESKKDTDLNFTQDSPTSEDETESPAYLDDSDNSVNRDCVAKFMDGRTSTGVDSMQYLYRLQAVILHYGSHDSGHFITYRRLCRNPFDPMADAVDATTLSQLNAWQSTKSTDRWFAISDDSVSLVKNVEQEVFGYASQYAYLLFYERVLSSKKD